MSVHGVREILECCREFGWSATQNVYPRMFRRSFEGLPIQVPHQEVHWQLWHCARLLAVFLFRDQN